MLEFNLFLIDNWYLSVPLFLSILLWFRSETGRGGSRVDCAQLTKLVNKQSAALLDVRPKKEFEAGSIAGAINIPFDELDSRHDELVKMQNKPIILFCSMGRNAALSGEKLQSHGYKDTYVLKGGISTWQQDGLPLVQV